MVFRKLQEWNSREIPATGLALCRILFSSVLFLEVTQLFRFRSLVFYKLPYLDYLTNDPTPFLLAWMGAIIFLILGLYTRTAAIINYFFTVLIIGSFSDYEYHIDFIYLSTNFLFIFLPISRRFSLDGLRESLRYSRPEKIYRPKSTASQLAYFAIPFASISLVYFDSIGYKWPQPMWRHGLGLWTPASLPQMTWLNLSFILNHEWLVKGMGFLVIYFESIFPFTFAIKKLRPIYLLVGLALHFGIFIAFPIPLFALGVCALYITMVPVGWYTALWHRLRAPFAIGVCTYRSTSLFQTRLRVLLEHFDLFERLSFKSDSSRPDAENPFDGFSFQRLDSEMTPKEGIEAFLIAGSILPPFAPLLKIAAFLPIRGFCAKLITLFLEGDKVPESSRVNQPLTSWWERQHVRFAAALFVFYIGTEALTFMRTPLAHAALGTILPQDKIAELDQSISRMHQFTRPLLGITSHPVFVQAHFANYKHLIALVQEDKETGQSTWLPLINDRGRADHYLSGRTWVKWTWRTVGPDINLTILKAGIKDFSKYWLEQHGLTDQDVRFQIKVRATEAWFEWRPDIVEQQAHQTWNTVGIAEWKSGTFSSEIQDIASWDNVPTSQGSPYASLAVSPF